MLENVPFKITDLDEIYLIDSFPIPMCQPIRDGRVNLLRDQGAYARERDAQVGFSASNCTFYQRGRGTSSERCYCRPVMMTGRGRECWRV